MELHRISLRRLRIRRFGLFVISIHTHIRRQRLICICRFRQLVLPCAVIEKPSFKRIVVFVRRRRQRQRFVPRSLYGVGRASVDIKCDRILRREGGIDRNIMGVGVNVFRQRPFGKGILHQLFGPCAFVRIPTVEREPLFLRRVGQPDLFIARSSQRKDELFVGIKRNRILLRNVFLRGAGSKNADGQNHAHDYA